MRLFERVTELENERVPFALAIVVSRRSPVSSHVGDRALVFADGRIEGFVGGSCSRDVVRRHGVEVIRSGTPRLLRIRPEDVTHGESGAEPGQPIFVAMSCASEGAVDVFIEPHLPAPRLIVVGVTPVALALARLASTIDYDVVLVAGRADLDDVPKASQQTVTVDSLRGFVDGLSASEAARTAAVVASLGQYDEAALDALLGADLLFIALVASRKRAARVFEALELGGRSREQLATVRSPAGLDIGARTPGDVAVSILAEIVATGSRVTGQESEAATPGASLARDPICGMDVEIEAARERLELNDQTYYFCSVGCRTAFAADPASALAAAGSP